MAPRATPEGCRPPDEGQPATVGRVPRAKSRRGSAQTAAIAVLVAERRSIRRRAQKGTGLSSADDSRLRAVDAEIDRLWADLRRQRLPLPVIPVRSAPRPAPRSAARR